MSFTTVSWLPGTTVCFGTHRFVVVTNGDLEWVRTAPSQPPPPVADIASAAGPSSTELGGSPPRLPFGLRSAAQTFGRLPLNVLAPPSDELVGMLDYDHESLYDVLNVQVNDSPSDSGSHHPSQECFMADTPEGHVQSGSGGDNPSATPNTGTAAGGQPQQLQQNPTPEQICARRLEVAEAKRQLEHEHQMLARVARVGDGPAPGRGRSTAASWPTSRLSRSSRARVRTWLRWRPYS